MRFNPARWLYGYAFEHMLIQLFRVVRGELTLLDITHRFEADAKRMVTSRTPRAQRGLKLSGIAPHNTVESPRTAILL